MPTQVESGNAFEFALADQIIRLTGAKADEPSLEKLKSLRAAYRKMSAAERAGMSRAAGEMTKFLRAYDDHVARAGRIILPSAATGRGGDVRDIILRGADGGGEVGISAKNRHWAVKHSRLSEKIDFGAEWAGCPASAAYWKGVRPTFAYLREQREKSGGRALFADIPNKADSLYVPVLAAFEDELERLCETDGRRFVRGLFGYLLGSHDHYKVVKENGVVAVQSINLRGTLRWGRRWSVPARLEQIGRKRGSKDTLLVSFAGGWQLSFRLHNASSRVEPSLKFDIQFVGVPHGLSRHEILIGRGSRGSASGQGRN